ncbi:hypothetical protein F4825DRAFT_443002 [Nemania diffusa]|nr:hypothetical protein F4825DRAFT_443002 [Nemania diffusa]
MIRIGESRAPECIDGIRRHRHKRELLQNRSIEHLRGRSMSVPPREHCTRIPDEGRECRRSHASLIRSRSPARSIARKEDCTNVDDIPPDNTLCQICREINAEDIMSEPGYRHLPLSELRESAKSCGLCRIISGTIGLSWYWVRERSIGCSLILRRGQAVVVDADSNGDEVRRVSYDLYFDGISHFSTFINTLQYALRWFTNEFDPAVKVGVPWRRRLLTNTRSDRSFDVARLWLGNCRGECDQYSVQPNDLPSRLIDLAPM